MFLPNRFILKTEQKYKQKVFYPIYLKIIASISKMQLLIPKHTLRHRNDIIANYFCFRLMAAILFYRGQ